jgi:predicted  nucleic acid-binding Zn-ribbon protein
MTQQSSPQPLSPPPDPFELATTLIRHAREALDEIRKTGRHDPDRLAELQTEIENLNRENRNLTERVEKLESRRR